MRIPTLIPAGLLMAAAMAAQTPTPPVAAPIVIPPVSPAVELKIDHAACHDPHQVASKTVDPKMTDPGDHCELGQTVTIRFSNLDDWVRADSAKHDPRNLVIALNGHALMGTHPAVMVAGSNTLAFELNAPENTDTDAEMNRQAWRAILRKHRSPTLLMLSVGLKDATTFYGSYPLAFRLYPPYATLVFIFIGILVLTVGYLAARSGLIRVPGPNPGDGTTRPYSLGRSQMAWWFLLIVASYLYIWLITNNRDSLTQGVLILVGISAATGLTSQIAGKPSGAAAAVPADPAAEPVPATTPTCSKGFLTDILTDENGISFDRFQMAAWTVVLGLVFVVEVFSDLHMPDFSPTLLGLMGISSGTYVGFKLPGK